MRVSERIRTRETCAYRHQCNAQLIIYSSLLLEMTLLHIASNALLYRAVLLKLLPLTLGEYKFGMN